MSTASGPEEIGATELEELVRGERFAKIPVETRLEEILGEAAINLLLVLAMLFWYGFKASADDADGWWREPFPVGFPLTLCVAALAVLVGACWWFTDVYYFLDQRDGTLYRASRFFWLRRARRVNNVADIVGVTVEGRAVGERGKRFRRTTWQYRAVAVDQTGDSLALSNWTGDFVMANARSAELSGLLGAHHQDGVPERELAVSLRAGAVDLEYRPHSLWRSNRAVWILLFVVVVFAITLVLRGYVFH